MTTWFVLTALVVGWAIFAVVAADKPEMGDNEDGRSESDEDSSGEKSPEVEVPKTSSVLLAVLSAHSDSVHSKGPNAGPDPVAPLGKHVVVPPLGGPNIPLGGPNLPLGGPNPPTEDIVPPHGDPNPPVGGPPPPLDGSNPDGGIPLGGPRPPFEGPHPPYGGPSGHFGGPIPVDFERDEIVADDDDDDQDPRDVYQEEFLGPNGEAPLVITSRRFYHIP